MAEKVRLGLAAREEFPIDSLIVKPGHRSAVEPNGSRRDDEVGALQAAVTEGRRFGKIGLVDKPGAGVDVRKQPWQTAVCTENRIRVDEVMESPRLAE